MMDFEAKAEQVYSKQYNRSHNGEDINIKLIAAALREAAASAFQEAGESDYEYDQVHADWCFAKAAALREVK